MPGGASSSGDPTVPPDRATGALDAVVGLAGELGLDPTGARIVRVGTSVLVGLPAAGVLARVDDGHADRSARQVAVARHLASVGVPAVRLAAVEEQPVVVPVGDHGAPVTLWVWEEVVDAPLSPAALGALARRLHDAPPPSPGAVPPADPLSAVDGLLAGAPGSPAGDLALLADAGASLRPAWVALATGCRGVVHADLHRDNVVMTAAGPRLADLELAGVGPPAYDLAPQVVAVRRYGADPADLDAFLAGYGDALPAPDVLEPLVAIYELWVTAWAVANRGLDEAHEHEARLRLARWRADGAGPAWTLR